MFLNDENIGNSEEACNKRKPIGTPNKTLLLLQEIGDQRVIIRKKQGKIVRKEDKKRA